MPSEVFVTDTDNELVGEGEGEDDGERVIIRGQNTSCCSKLGSHKCKCVIQLSFPNCEFTTLLIPGWQSRKHPETQICGTVECC